MTNPVTDEMVERAWAAIVGFDVAGQCFVASLTRADLRDGLVAALGARETVDINNAWHPMDTLPKDQEVEVRGLWKLRGDGVEFTHWRTPLSPADNSD